MSITLEQSRAIGSEVRLAGGHLTAHLRLIGALVPISEISTIDDFAKAKGVITSHLEAVLAGASSIKVGAVDPSNPTQEECVEARKKVWLSIKQETSKNNLFFVDGERPQATKGKNWRVHWSAPQVKTKAVDDGVDHTPKAQPTAATTPETLPTAIILPELSMADKLLQIESLLDGLDLKASEDLAFYLADRIKALTPRKVKRACKPVIIAA